MGRVVGVGGLGVGEGFEKKSPPWEICEKDALQKLKK